MDFNNLQPEKYWSLLRVVLLITYALAVFTLYAVI